MVILVAAASTSVLFAAFYRATQLPADHKRHHVYGDDDGEAVPAEHDDVRDRPARILIAFSSLAVFILSAWNWVTQEHASGLAIITILWVRRQSSYLLISLTRPADNHHFGLFFASSTIVSKATTLRNWSASSYYITHIVVRVGNCHIQGISKSSDKLDPNCHWSLPCLRMLFFTAAA